MAVGVKPHPGNHRNPMLVAELQAFSPVDRVVDDPAILGNAKISAGGGAQYFHSAKFHPTALVRHGVISDLHGLRLPG